MRKLCNSGLFPHHCLPITIMIFSLAWKQNVLHQIEARFYLSLSLFPSPFFLFLQFNSCITHFHNAGLTLENGHRLIQRNWKIVSESTCSTGRPLVSSILGSMPSDASDYVVGLIPSKVTFDSVYLCLPFKSDEHKLTKDFLIWQLWWQTWSFREITLGLVLVKKFKT